MINDTVCLIHHSALGTDNLHLNATGLHERTINSSNKGNAFSVLEETVI